MDIFTKLLSVFNGKNLEATQMSITGEWLNKLWNMQMRKYSPAIKKTFKVSSICRNTEEMCRNVSDMDLYDILLSTKKNSMYVMSPLMSDMRREKNKYRCFLRYARMTSRRNRYHSLLSERT